MTTRLCVTCLLLLIYGVALGQEVKPMAQAIPASLKPYTGRILFTSRSIAPSRLQPQDVLQTYRLTNKSSLYLTAILAHPLTYYMQQLMPALSTDSLHSISGYQFICLIDGKAVYTSNIQGAPLPALRDTETVLVKPLIDEQREGVSWAQYFWGRFMNNGGDQALTDGPHRLQLEIRPHVQEVTGDPIATGELNLIVERDPVIDTASVALNPVKPYPGLPVSADPFNTGKIKELKGRIADNQFKKVSSIVVIKHGKLLIEEYFNGTGRDSLLDTRSVGKSFAAALTGIAIQDGHIKSDTQSLQQFYRFSQYPHYAPAKEKLQIRDLLTMRAILDGDDNNNSSPGNEENMYPTDNWVKFALGLPASETRPAGLWHYFTAGVVILGDILNQSVPGGLERYADKKLFGPLGIQQRQWMYTPQQVPSTAGGLRLKALDLAKFGQLYKNGGRWNGRQVLPRAWVEKSFYKHTAIPDRPNEYYGYLFWNKRYVVNGKSYEAWYCTGNGGNKIFVFKDQPLVIVITASAYNQPYAHPQADKMMAEYILPAVLPR